jgi:type IV pilus assembly protein PilV
MLGARGCITNPAPDVWVVTVAWQGMAPTVAPEEACGAGQYGNDKLRRTVSLIVRRAILS